jgi:hypothetical protein
MWPQDKSVIKQPGFVNPMASVPAEQFGRSIDRFPPAPPGGGGGGGFDGEWPLKLVAVNTENVKVVFGTVNGFTPTDVETNIDVSGSDGTWAIYMQATISATSVTGAAVGSDSGGSVPSDDATNSYRLIGEVDVVSSVITAVRPAMAWSQEVVVCTAEDPSSFHWVAA